MSALTPRPGIMKIAPYVPGKDSIEARQTIAKLSSNEGALGPSPKAMAAYAKAAAELHRYPDGGAQKLRARSAGTMVSMPGGSSAVQAPTSC
jgi:Histidinol-phosphate/aromatic aminotransferase and cobyric acid decarboxylase